jgi:hypothetical protein
LVVGEADAQVVHVAKDVAAMGGEGGGQVVGAALQGVALAPSRRVGVGGEAVGDEGVVAGGEGALAGGGKLAQATAAGVLAGGVDLDEQRGEPARPRLLRGDGGDVGEVAQQVRTTEAVLGLSFQYMARRSWTMVPR